ncbi:asparagine synthase (glutamine-hydrolyzing) [Magnetospirillum sulfuroxidans]|uniref:asparagine synthase (glutamine-hydrolyzing) n=1 Tax=Magnetospirillum sulfuroxidans TaxID=611300 RepID=A0ABS5IGZ5_9PROT|nr:asparagine synthase (glutamine-hydrolyzing) [Magnetospirillum sulfuroxidans]MBR9973706.1 asparagine synthase (glutamine-hydrolyzing) [Magnetospirillum sulfuroxidans]
MCGLAAIFAHHADSKPVDAAELQRIRDRMTVRGPDGAGQWLAPSNRVGLAHRRLSILDLSDAGAQPMASADGRLIMVFNGEIYNFRDLRDELQQAGAIFRSHGDTEVVLELYARYGVDGLSRLRGMFAIALWDHARQGLLLARDGYGIKPLYYADQGGCIRAASQVKALLAGGAIDTSPDPAGHVGFRLWGHVPEPHTLYRHIRAVAPGGWMWWGQDGNHCQGRFFDIAQTIRLAPADASVDLGAALADSVRHHLIADVPVGVFLSAGLDSTTIAALAAQAMPSERLKTITLAFDELAGTDGDEAPLAEQVAAHYGADHATCRIPAGDFAASSEQILADMDQPSIDGVNVWFVARAARQRGLKVALSGLGGDEIFAGYDSFRQLPQVVSRLKAFGWTPFLGRGLRAVSAPWLSRFTSPKWAGLLEYGTNLSDAYLLRRGLFMPWELPQVMDPEMARAGWRDLQPRLALAETIEGIDNPRLAVSALESAFYMRNQLLRDADWAGMAHSLEIRVPLVDTVLLSQVVSLVKAGKPPSKLDMAACARPVLPDAVLRRRKTGFFVPIAQWMGQPHLRGWAATVLAGF